MALPKEAAGQRLALFFMALCLAAQAPRAESAPCTTQSACSAACGGSYAFTSGSGGTSTYNSCTATSSNPCCCTSGSGYNPSCAAPASPSPAPVVFCRWRLVYGAAVLCVLYKHPVFGWDGLYPLRQMRCCIVGSNLSGAVVARSLRPAAARDGLLHFRSNPPRSPRTSERPAPWERIDSFVGFPRAGYAGIL